MRAVLTTLTICILLASPAYADRDDPDADGPDFRQADIAFAYEVSDEAYAAFSMRFARARAHYLTGNFTGSIKELERAFMLVRDPMVLLNLAISYDVRADVEAEKGEYRKARVDKRMALHLYKSAGRAKLSDADSALCGKKLLEVRRTLGRLREVDPMLATIRMRR